MKRFIVVLSSLFSLNLFAETQLLLNWKPEAEFGGFYSAVVNKLFEKEGLKVEIVPGGVGSPAVQMVAAGRADFGIASADEVIIAQDRGADVVALYAVYQTNPQGLMVRDSRKIEKIEGALSNGLLAVQRGLPYFQFLEKKYQPIKAKIVPFLGGVTQLAENAEVTQQCFVTSEPILAERKGLKVKTFLIADAGFNPYATMVVTRGGLAKESKAKVAAFVRAVDAGWKQYLKDPKPANELMHQHNPTMDLDTLAKSAGIQKPLIQTQAGVGAMTEQRWNQLAKQLKDLGLVKTIKAGAEYFLKVN